MGDVALAGLGFVPGMVDFEFMKILGVSIIWLMTYGFSTSMVKGQELIRMDTVGYGIYGHPIWRMVNFSIYSDSSEFWRSTLTGDTVFRYDGGASLILKSRLDDLDVGFWASGTRPSDFDEIFPKYSKYLPLLERAKVQLEGDESTFQSAWGVGNIDSVEILSFNASHFTADVVFWGLGVCNEADFWAIQADSAFNFGQCHVFPRATFSHAKFDGPAIFRGTHWKTVLDMSHVTFQGIVDFSNGHLPPRFHLDHINTEHKIDLTLMALDSGQTPCQISLVGSDLSKIKLDYQKYQLAWPEGTPIEEQRNIYETLLKQFETNGYRDSYRLLDIEYRDFEYIVRADASRTIFGRVWHTVANWFDRWWWQYGYQKERILRNTGLLFLLFFMVNWRLYPFLNLAVYRTPQVWQAYRQRRKRPFRARLGKVWNRAFHSLLYTGLVFFGLRMHLEHFQYRYRWGVVYLYFQYVVGLVCLGYLANFVVTG